MSRRNFRATRMLIYERDLGVCHICGEKVSIDDFHLDHVTPLSRGGTDTLNNVKVSHPRCNLAKLSKLDVENFEWSENLEIIKGSVGSISWVELNNKEKRVIRKMDNYVKEVVERYRNSRSVHIRDVFYYDLNWRFHNIWGLNFPNDFLKINEVHVGYHELYFKATIRGQEICLAIRVVGGLSVLRYEWLGIVILPIES